MDAGDLPADDETLHELARLRSPVVVYLLDGDFRVTFSSDGTAPGPLSEPIAGIVEAMRPELEEHQSAVASLSGARIVRAERLIGASAEIAYAVFIEQVAGED